ncbi:Hypothetical_protein [Hexamita inflata]|uniref:Hypothetical_protein n=1 Tax=Hexamita inflata TaxID=28002 RepID=A0AA86QAZ9_9EUKA|nr:Hypothetical protein HINF_LOCUS37237 [Hexamita inflata]
MPLMQHRLNSEDSASDYIIPYAVLAITSLRKVRLWLSIVAAAIYQLQERLFPLSFSQRIIKSWIGQYCYQSTRILASHSSVRLQIEKSWLAREPSPNLRPSNPPLPTRAPTRGMCLYCPELQKQFRTRIESCLLERKIQIVICRVHVSKGIQIVFWQYYTILKVVKLNSLY